MKRKGQPKLQNAAKSEARAKEPLVKGLSLPGPTSPFKRKAGRPPGAKNKPKLDKKKPLQERIKTSYQGMIDDAETLRERALTIGITEPLADGGGTADNAPVVTKESLERRIARRLNVLDRYLTDERLLALLAVSTLKEVGVYEGIMLDKSLVLQGQPTVIVGSHERAQINEVLPKLMAEMKRRGMVTVAKERSIEFRDGGVLVTGTSS